MGFSRECRHLPLNPETGFAATVFGPVDRRLCSEGAEHLRFSMHRLQRRPRQRGSQGKGEAHAPAHISPRHGSDLERHHRWHPAPGLLSHPFLGRARRPAVAAVRRGALEPVQPLVANRSVGREARECGLKVLGCRDRRAARWSSVAPPPPCPPTRTRDRKQVPEPAYREDPRPARTEIG